MLVWVIITEYYESKTIDKYNFVQRIVPKALQAV